MATATVQISECGAFAIAIEDDSDLRHAVNIATRASNPAGTFDKAGRWFPDHTCPSCSSIRRPSRAWKYSYLCHARSVKHLAHEFNLEPAVLRAAIKRVGGR